MTSRTNKLKKEIYKEIAKELGMSLAEVSNIAESQYLFIKQIMQRGGFEQVRLPYLGKFHVKPYRAQQLNQSRGTVQRRKLSSNNRSGDPDNS